MPRLETTVTATATTTVKLAPALKKKLQMAFKTYGALAAQAKVLDAAMKSKRGDVEGIMEEIGESSIALDGFRSTVVAPVRKGKFNPTTAVKLGIPLSKIEQCYDPDEPGTPYVKITVPGAKED